VSTQIKVIPTDDAKLNEIIDLLGKKMLNLNEDAAPLLGLIHDKRTIKYHIQFLEKIKGFEKSIQSVITSGKLWSVRSLGYYDDDAALEAIKSLMSSPDKDRRHVVAVALLSSPHPKALNLLLLMQSDEDADVRLNVVYGLGKIESAESTSRLREMLKDKEQKVRAKAQEYLAERKIKIT
jgi:HEAT repeat protein